MPDSSRSFSNCLIVSPLVSISATMSSEAQYVNFDPSSLHQITDEMIFYVDMLGSSTDLLTLSQTYDRLVVFKNSGFSDALVQQITCE